MAVVTELSGDSNEDPNKKPEEEAKKPLEVVAKTRRTRNSLVTTTAAVSENSEDRDQNKNPGNDGVHTRRTLSSLPRDMLISIIGRIQRLGYPTLSLTCQEFLGIVSSRELYRERMLIKNTEPFLYASIGFEPVDLRLPNWYILYKTQGAFRLRLLDSVANMASGSTVLTIGFNMYVIGGRVETVPQSSVFVVDCRFHNSRLLPTMHRARFRAAAGVIDGKIYVLGGCNEKQSANCWVEVFDVTTETWSNVPCPYIDDTGPEFETCAVIGGKVYCLGRYSFCSYEPTTGEWELLSFSPPTHFDRQLTRVCGLSSSCVVDGTVFAIDPYGSQRYPIVSFDLKSKCTRLVECRGPFRWPNLFYHNTRMANFGGKIVILCSTTWPSRIWCLEVRLRISRHNGQQYGYIERAQQVLKHGRESHIEHCHAPAV